MIRVDNGDGTITFTLAKPVRHGDKTFETVTLKDEASAYDLEAMDGPGGNVAATLRVLSRLTEISAERPGLKLAIVRKLGSEDYLELAKAVGKIIGGGASEVDEENDGGGNEEA